MTELPGPDATPNEPVPGSAPVPDDTAGAGEPSPDAPGDGTAAQACPIELLLATAIVSTTDEGLVARLGDALARPPAVRLLDVHADPLHGRTLFTALGEPEALVGALVELGRRAAEEVDLRKHHGPFPRVGALDVVALTPMVPPLPPEAASGLVETLGQRLARDAGLACVPFGAADPNRRDVPDLMAGGIHALLARVDKLEVPAWRPDHDTRDRRARSGFTLVGALPAMARLVVELETTEVGHARRIARQLTEGADASPALRASGIRLGEARVAVALEVLDPLAMSATAAFEALERMVQGSGPRVLRSEVIGCLPAAAWPDGASDRVKAAVESPETRSRRLLESWLPGGALDADPGTLPLRGEEIPAGAEGAGADGTPAESAASQANRAPRDSRLRVLDLPLPEARAALQQLVAEIGERAFRANQVLHAIHGRRVRDFAAMTDLPAGLRDKLAERARIGLVELVEKAVASDGTVKYLWRLADGGEIESVAIPSDRRTTFCVSSQVGCALKCGFCATGYLGLGRNLTPGEMVDQVLAMLEDGRQAQSSLNVVFMGMGEPGYNMEAVLAATRTLNDAEGLGIGARHVTISTAGVVPAIERLAREPLQLRLAVSLHAADQALRESLMNVAERFPLDQLLAACQAYHDATGRHVTFEYVVIPGVNDRAEDARRLGDYASRVGSKVNLIPYNPVEGFDAPEASEGDLERFREELRRSYRAEVMIRQTRGRDIDAACGMLHRTRHAAAPGAAVAES